MALRKPGFAVIAAACCLELVVSVRSGAEMLHAGSRRAVNASFGTRLCITGVHAWIMFHDECPVHSRVRAFAEMDGQKTWIRAKTKDGTQLSTYVARNVTAGDQVIAELPLSPEQETRYEELGCGLGKEVLQGADPSYQRHAILVVQGSKVQFGDGRTLGTETAPDFVCRMPFAYTIPIPDMCSRGIVADLLELYLAQGISYALDGTLRLNPQRLSPRCRRSKEYYINKLKSSGTRNCWGPAIDFKRMYCAFYGGYEAFQSRKNLSGQGSCATSDCCTQGRRLAREALKTYLTGETIGKKKIGIVDRMIPDSIRRLMQ